MQSSDSLKSEWYRAEDEIPHVHTVRESTWIWYRWHYLYTYIFVYLKNKTTKNYLISSNFFWHIMNFKSDTSKFSNTTYQTSIWIQVINYRVTLVLNNWNQPAEVTGGPTERLVLDLTAKVRVGREAGGEQLGVRGGSLGPSYKLVTWQSCGKSGRPRATHCNSAAAQTHGLLHFKSLLTSTKPTRPSPSIKLPNSSLWPFSLH